MRFLIFWNSGPSSQEAMPHWGHGPVVQNREPRNKSSNTWPIDFVEGGQYHSMEKEQSFQQMMPGKVGICMGNNKDGSLSYTICRN